MQAQRITLVAVVLGCLALLSATAHAQSADRLSAAASVLAGEPVLVERGHPETTRAETWIAENRIVMRPELMKKLLRIPSFDYFTTPWAVAVFAHEVGHIVRGMSESDAACFARANMYRAARTLGFGPYKARAVAKLARQDQLAYCPSR